MHIDEYISQFLEYEPIQIDSTDDRFLRHVMLHVNTSYKIHSLLEKIEDFEPDPSKRTTPMAYKNVNRRMHRLRDAGLLEEVPKSGGYDHGAKNYRVTSRGLVYLFSDGIPYFSSICSAEGLSPIPLEDYYDGPLFKTFIHPHLQRQTLLRSTNLLAIILDHYMQDICKNIRFFLSHENISLYIEDGKIDVESFADSYPMKELNFNLDWCIRSFVIKISTMKAQFIDWQLEEYNKPIDKDKKKTLALLAKDKKFMKALTKAGREFLNGYARRFKKAITQLRSEFHL
jgi:hypothetical protein